MTVMITGFPTIATAVEAVKEGAFDYLPKPFTPDQLLIVVDRALSQKRLTEENLLLRKRSGFGGDLQAWWARAAPWNGWKTSPF